MLASQAVKFGLTIVSAAILARLLTPEDYGLIAMVTVVINFTYSFRNLGLSTATMQKPQLMVAQVTNLFWINTGLSIIVMLLTAASAPLVARFYGDSRLTWITIALASGFVFTGLTVQHEALLKRQMRFFALSTVEISSLIIGLISALIAASRGMKYWSLVISSLTTSFVYFGGVWLVCRWRPGLPSRKSGVRSMLWFGGHLTGSSLVNFAARNIDNVLIGRYWGPTQLGLYSRAYQLLLLPLEQINAPLDTVAITSLSKLTDSPERYRQAYLRMLEKIVMVTMPGIALMIVTSDWLVRVMLGPQWVESGRIFALLGVMGILEPVSFTLGWLMVSQARTKEFMHMVIFNSVTSILAIILGLRWGAIGVAAIYALSGVVIRKPVLLWWAGRRGPVRTQDIYRTILPALVASGVVATSLFLLRRVTGFNNPVLGLVCSLFLAVLLAGATYAALPDGRRALQDAWRLLPHLSRRKT